MAHGPGKYDEAATQAREATKARGVVLIVMGGEHGGGFSAQLTAEDQAGLPSVLRQVADEIERSGSGVLD